MDVLNYWVKNNVAGHALSAFVYINSKSQLELKDAVYYFGAAYAGFMLPLSCQKEDIWSTNFFSNLLPSGEPGSWGGHAVPIVGYDSEYVYCVTWGAIKKMTWKFYSNYCDEVYALLSPDWLTNGKCPSGFAMATLQQDLSLLKEV